MAVHDRRVGFSQGVICCAAWLAQAHGEDTLAVEMLREFSVFDDVSKYGDDSDCDILLPLIEDELSRQSYSGSETC